MTILYIKTHNVTGLKYFGKSMRSDESFDTYRGSGKYWLNHIKKHGYDVTTTIFAKFDETVEEQRKLLVETALKFSIDNDIVKSKDWANLKFENGLDGNPKGIEFSEETHKKWKLRSSGENNPMYNNGEKVSGTKNGRHKDNFTGDIEEIGKKISEKIKGKKTWNYGKKNIYSDDVIKKMSDAKKDKPQPRMECPYCGREGAICWIKGHHMKKCKENNID